MSETNGKPELTLADLQEQVEKARLAVELRHLKATESVFDQAQDFVNPAEPLFDSPDFIYPWYGENVPYNIDNRLRGELLPVYITEYGLKILRDYSRWLLAYNPWAIQIRENKISYFCGKGFGYTCAPVERYDNDTHSRLMRNREDRDLCRMAQRFLDRFRERVNWGAWEQQMIAKDTCDGEAFLRFFHLGDGEITVRPVEPEHVRSPGDQTAHQSFGIETPEHDILDVRGFWVVQDPQYSWMPSLVPANEILHIRSGVGPTAKRGYPCLVPVRQNLSRAANLLRIMTVLASSQSSIAGIRKWKQYSVADIQGFQQNNSDFQFTDPLSSQQRFIKRYLPGTFLDVPQNVDYEFPASKIAAAALVEVLQAELRAIASRFNWPEYMVGADASNANYASTQVAEAPGVKQLEREQASYARAFGDGTFAGPAQCGALWRVLYLGVRYGKLPRAILQRVKLQAEGPSLVARDKDKETARAETLHRNGILGKGTWSKWEGVDRQEEKEDLERDPPAAQTSTEPGGSVDQQGGLDPQTIQREAQDWIKEVYQLTGEKVPVMEACVRNRSGRGSHDDQTGYPCGGETSRGTRNGEKTAEPSGLKAASSRAAEILKAGGNQTKKIAGKAKQFAEQKFAKLEAKFGRKGAIVIMAAVVAMTPVPVPGSTFAPLIVAAGVKQLLTKFSRPAQESFSHKVLRVLKETTDASGHEHDPSSGQFTGPGGGSSNVGKKPLDAEGMKSKMDDIIARAREREIGAKGDRYKTEDLIAEVEGMVKEATHGKSKTELIKLAREFGIKKPLKSADEAMREIRHKTIGRLGAFTRVLA